MRRRRRASCDAHGRHPLSRCAARFLRSSSKRRLAAAASAPPFLAIDLSSLEPPMRGATLGPLLTSFVFGASAVAPPAIAQEASRASFENTSQSPSQNPQQHARSRPVSTAYAAPL